MSAWPAMQFEQEPQELASFVRYLRRLNFPHRVTEQQGILILWVFEQPHIEWVQQQYQRMLAGEINMSHSKAPRAKITISAMVGQVPLTFLLILFSLFGFAALVFNLFLLVSFLSFQGFAPYSLSGSEAIAMNGHQQWLQLMQQGQWWRLFTPMFLHFSLSHLAFNSVLLWYLGQQLEQRLGWIYYLSWVLLMSLAANCAQYLASPQLFGGMSGVVYGLIAYCSIVNYQRGESVYVFPRGLFGFAIISMAAGFLGLFSLLGLQIANWAHLAGFVMGGVLAVVPLKEKSSA